MASEAVTKRQALEVLQSAQEGLSVKAVLELQRMEQVSPSMKAAVAAAICMVSGHYDTAIQVEPLALSRAAWPELRALVVKPGQVISALRNFSFAVDGGNVPARVVQVSKECYEAGEGSPSEEEPFLKIQMVSRQPFACLVALVPLKDSWFSKRQRDRWMQR
eukprot:symbB.v1.2.032854.t3/scaffold4003.1/size46508/4